MANVWSALPFYFLVDTALADESAEPEIAWGPVVLTIPN
jgi:hypothetical protein